MTLKEKVAEINPEDINNYSYSGVEHCPVYYPYLNQDNEGCPKDKHGNVMTCTECWNREFVEKEKENMPEVNGKDIVAEKIKELECQVKLLKDDIKKYEKYEVYKKGADELFMVRQAFIDAGFTEEDAFELMKLSMSMAVKK